MFEEFYKSLTSISYYKKLCNKHFKHIILYDILLITIVSVLINIIIFIYLNNKLYSPILKYAENLPSFSLSNKGLYTKEQIPFKIKEKEYLVEINGYQKVSILANQYVNDNTPKKILVGTDGIVTISNNKITGYTKFSDVNELKNTTLTNKDFSYLGIKLKKTFAAISFLLLLSFLILGYLTLFIRALSYSLFVFIYSKIYKKRISFKVSYKLSLYASTSYILLWGIVMALPISVEYIYRIISLNMIPIIYLYLVLKKYDKSWEVN